MSNIYYGENRGRNDNVEDLYVKKMKEIDGTVEAGGWAGVEFTNKINPRAFLPMLTS